jgi:large subunit ribosomal protein L22
MPETAARLRHHRTSPTKVRQVLRLIVGKDVADAREILRFCERGPAETVMKLLDSAVANAEHNDSMPEEELFVTRAFADEGPTMKRWRPRARGRGTRIRKRTSHITIVVARYEDDALEQRRQREAADTQAQRASRRRRVAGSQRKAEREAAREAEHDHDHEDEIDEEVDELIDESEVDETDVDEVETADVDTDAVETAETDTDDVEIEAETEDAPEAEASDDAAEAPEDEKSEKPEGSK